MKKFTVLLLYPEFLTSYYGPQTYCTGVRALSPILAIATAQAEIVAGILKDTCGEGVDGHAMRPGDFSAVAVFAGWLKDLCPR